MAEILWIGTGVAATSMALGCLGSGALGFLLEGRTLLGATFGQGLALPAPRWVAAVGIGTPLALVLGSAPRVIRLASVPPDIALRRRD
jgi:hypothetical protein